LRIAEIKEKRKKQRQQYKLNKSPAEKEQDKLDSREKVARQLFRAGKDMRVYRGYRSTKVYQAWALLKTEEARAHFVACLDPKNNRGGGARGRFKLTSTM